MVGAGAVVAAAAMPLQAAILSEPSLSVGFGQQAWGASGYGGYLITDVTKDLTRILRGQSQLLTKRS